MSMENVRKLLYHEYGLDPYELRLLMMVADWTGDDGKGFAKSAKPSHRSCICQNELCTTSSVPCARRAS